ncbi:MAG: flagellar hook-length control protein FliK [Mariprofundaceae bacterium]
MIEQTINTQGGLGSLTGEADGSAKSAKGGLFSKLMASFQKHLDLSEAGLVSVKQVDAGVMKLSLDGEAESLLKSGVAGLKAVKAEGAAKAELLSGVMIEGEVAPEAASEVKSLLIGSNAQAMESELEGHKLKLVKDQADAEAEINVFAGLAEAGQDKNTLLTDKKLGLIGLQQKQAGGGEKGDADAEAKKLLLEASSGQSKVAGQQTDKGAALVDKGGLNATAQQAVSKGKFSLSGLTKNDKSADATALLKADVSAVQKSVQKQVQKQDVASLSNANTVDDGVDTTGLLRKAAQLNSNQDDGVMLEAAKQDGSKPEAAKVATALNASAAKSRVHFQPVTANKVGAASASSAVQSPGTVTSTPVDVVAQAAQSQNSNMSDGERGMGRSVAEMMLGDTSVGETRATRSEFAAQLAYKSAPAFKPSDAMIEISKAARDGSMKLEMQLEPATLGKIQVTMQMDAAKQIQVHLLVDQNSSRQVMEQQLPQLRQALADQGLNLAGFSMDMGSQQQQEQGDGSPKGMAFGAFGENAQGASMPQGSNISLGVNMASDGRLNILA